MNPTYPINPIEHLSTEAGSSLRNQFLSFHIRLNSVQILGLDADTNYNIEVFAEQISTHLLSKSVDLSFTTKRPSKIIT